MSRVSYKEFEQGKTKETNVFELKINLVEDPNGGFTSFFNPDPGIISEGETKEEAVLNLFQTLETVLKHTESKLKFKKILPE